MKRFQLFIIATALLLFAGFNASASVPKSMDYNLMLINPQTGHVMTNKSAEVRLELRQGSQSGTAVWSKNYSVKSDATGMVHITLDFSDNIDWDAAEYYLAMLVDNKEAGAAKLMSVPYAFVAERLSNVLTREELIGTWSGNDEVWTFNENGTGYWEGAKGSYAITWLIGPTGVIFYSYHMETGGKLVEKSYIYPYVKLSSTKIAWNNGYFEKQ